MKNDLELICNLVRECGKFIKGIDRGHLHIDSKEGRANFVVPSIYDADSKAYKVVTAIIDKIRIDQALKELAK